MMMDYELTLSDQQNLAQAAGSYFSTNTIDLGAAATNNLGQTIIKDPGRGKTVQIFAQVTETFTSGAAGTLVVELVMSANADLTSPTVLQKTDTLALATLVAGYQFRLGKFLPVGISARYLGLRYTIATAAMTAGKVTAGLILDRQENPSVSG